MLSNPTTSLHARQRQHRRQNSTSSAFEGVKVQNLPNVNRRQAAGHRRGLSLDTRRQQQQPQQQITSPTARQDSTVSMSTNNTGLANTSQHRVLREAQQQRTQARPGPQHHHHHHQQQQPQHYVSYGHNDPESFLISPHATPQTQRFEASCFETSSAPFDPYGEQLNMMMRKNQGSYGTNMSSSKDFDLFTAESPQSTPNYLNMPESPSNRAWMPDGAAPTIRRSTRRISDGIVDRVSKYENMSPEERPITPPNQNGNAYYPPTPMETPHDRFAKQDARPTRFSDDYDGSMEETIKPNRNRGQHNVQNMFQDMSQQTQPCVAAPSPPSSTPMTHSKTFSNVSQDFMNMNSFRNEFIKMEGGFANQPQEHDFLNEQDLSHQTTPDTQHLDAFGGGFDQNRADLQPFEALRQAEDEGHRSSHRRTESVASMASAASIASINIEETKTETGVTVEEISQYIQGPETTDGKWMCLFEDCGKQFGRKENIKSHVQTHLNDRQYQCPHCKKCFVRQHDLKRHAKIHTGIKPYPCECGNSFARHDALTRHRQRGMCIGAFDGIVRKVVKRGRPKKSRPDMETRMEKSSRQRKKNMSISSMSSLSGYSDSSAVNSPDADFNMLDDVMDMGPIDSHMEKVASVSSAPMPNMVRRSEEASASPYAASGHSYVSPEAIMDKAPSHPASPAKSAMSHYNTPPELSQSSSPPPPVRLFPADPSNSMGADDLAGLSAMNNLTDASGMNNTLPMGADQQNDDMMLQFTNDDGLVQLERDPSMLMMSKFDEEFNMFTNNDDMFFGSS